MTKSKRIFMWIMIAIVAILIIYIIITGRNKAGAPISNSKPVINPNTNTITTDASQAGIDTTAPPTTVEQGGFKIGDKIYAGEDILNSYSSCSPSQNNIVHTFNKGDYIGTYVRTEGNCIVVSINTYYTYWLGISWSVPTGSTDNYLIYTANIYVK